MTKQQIENLVPQKYKAAFENLAVNYKDTKLKERHKIIQPLKKAGLKHFEARKLGFKASNELWQNNDETERNLGEFWSVFF